MFYVIAMVTKKKICLEYTQRDMRRELKLNTTKTSVKYKRNRQQHNNNRRIPYPTFSYV